jgi:RNA polymerase sigma-70 factor (ECF subfamily)
MDELLAELMPSLHALCVNVLGVGAEAEDALQEALIAVFRGIERFRGESQVSTWAYRITIRVAMRQAAKRKRHEGVSYEDTARAIGSVVTSARVKQILVALTDLSPKHRVVLALFAIEGLSHDEISEILGIPEGTVWSRLHHARRALAIALGEPFEQLAQS